MVDKSHKETQQNRRIEPVTGSARAEIDDFLARVKELGPARAAGPRGRLIFALDATMSRQPTWDTACRLQGEMFREAASIGGLEIQLVYYRGLAECRASTWVSQADKLARLMEHIDCRGGHTQIGKVLNDVLAKNRFVADGQYLSQIGAGFCFFAVLIVGRCASVQSVHVVGIPL